VSSLPVFGLFTLATAISENCGIFGRNHSKNPAVSKTRRIFGRQHSENPAVSNHRGIFGQTVGTMLTSLFEQIVNEIEPYRQRTRPAVLRFRGLRCSQIDDVPAEGGCGYHDDVDLFEDVRSLLFTKNIIIRFDPKIHPVNGGWKKNSGGQKLLSALCAASKLTGGYELKCNGGTKKGSNRKTNFGPKHCLYDSLSIARKAVKTGKPQAIYPVRSTTYHSVKTNTHGELGKSMKKRTTTSRPLPAEETFKVHLILDYDDKCGIGQGTHTKHVPMTVAEMVVRVKLIDEEIQKYQNEIAIAYIQPCKTAAAVNTRLGIRLTRHQVAYHQGFSTLASSLADVPDVEGAGTSSSDLDVFIKILKKKGASLCAPYHRSKEASASVLPKPKKSEAHTGALSEEMLRSETGSAFSSDTRCEIVGEPGALGEDIMKYAREGRVSVNADDNQDVLLAIVWVIPNGKQLFRAYSEVMFIDGTRKTNKEYRPLITMGVEDCDGKMQIVLRAFVSNESAWLFCWLFQGATP
jgi:hypothetical protein